MPEKISTKTSDIARFIMGRARHPMPYKKGKRQVTVPWKLRVLAKLAENKKNNKTPCNIDQLMKAVDAKKGSLNTLLKLNLDPPQLTSAYEAEISAVLEIESPLLEQEGDDDEFIRDVNVLRSLAPNERRDLMAIARRMTKKL